MMAEKIQAIRGMNDILPHEIAPWQRLEETIRQSLFSYGYQEIRFPVVESTYLFKRSIGDVTDIVEKEMYTFTDLNGDSLTLRPEGTAGCLRACLEHGLLHRQAQKLWYMGPMFRHEKPQKGRYRQFHQLGVEVIGIEGVAVELELIALCRHMWKKLGLSAHLQLHINTIGNFEERQQYKKLLVAFFTEHYEALDEDSKRRLHTNPLRILDSKHTATQALLKDAPKLFDCLHEDSRQRFTMLCSGLDAMGVDYVINPLLVRGLDYYGHLVFEWVTDKLGSQATVCAGGRYDALVEQLGGKSSPAVGFAVGIERLLLLLSALEITQRVPTAQHLFLMATTNEGLQTLLQIAELLREANPALCVEVNLSVNSLKSQFKKADKSGADYALIIGEDELIQKKISVKNLRKATEQVTIPAEELIALFVGILRET